MKLLLFYKFILPLHLNGCYFFQNYQFLKQKTQLKNGMQPCTSLIYNATDNWISRMIEEKFLCVAEVGALRTNYTNFLIIRKMLRTVQLRCFFTAPPKPVGHKIEWGGLKFNDHR